MCLREGGARPLEAFAGPRARPSRRQGGSRGWEGGQEMGWPGWGSGARGVGVGVLRTGWLMCIKCARRPPSPRESPCEVVSLPVVMRSSLKIGPVPLTSVSASLQHRARGRVKCDKRLKGRRYKRRKRREEGQTDEVRDNQRGNCLIYTGWGMKMLEA